MLKKLRIIGYFFVIGILPKFFDVPKYFKYFTFLVIFLFIDDIYKLIKKDDNEQ